MQYKRQGKKDEVKEKWKKKIMHDYNKLKRKPQPAGLDVQKLYEEMSDSDDEPKSVDPAPQGSSSTSVPREKFDRKKEASRFSRAQWEHQKKAEKKRQKYEEILKKKREKEAALEHYRAKKKAKFLKMCKKTPKGQPIMKYRIHHLLDQIEKQYGKQKKESENS
ncbi:uncharacterized protein LOC143286403 [Babylonia areolata]|uniref:uncharacterized protein LOC143286403 n=1 Tax=Babylonia areolata TaxID=304850 RepID=UPI003FD35677